MLRWGRSTSAPQRAGWQKHTLNKPRVGGLAWQPVGCLSEPQPPPAQVVSSTPLSPAHPTSLIGDHQAPRALGLLPGPKVSSSPDGLLPSPSAQGLWEPPSCPKRRKALLWPQGLSHFSASLQRELLCTQEMSLLLFLITHFLLNPLKPGFCLTSLLKLLLA